jgi:hypothetical protein
MTADERLEAIQVKIGRAKAHTDDLRSAISDFFASTPYKVAAKHDPQTRKPVYYVSSVCPTPVCFATITGDIIQNLRSALDHLAYQLFLVGTNGTKGPGRHICFLIAANAARYKDGFGGTVKGMRQDAIDALSAVEPYNGGKGHQLWVLHELNNIDKHRLLVTVGSNFQSLNVGAHMAAMFKRAHGIDLSLDAFLRPADDLCPLKVGDELFIDAVDAEVNDKMSFRFDVVLKEAELIDGAPLLEAVQNFTDMVSNTVLQLKPYLA